MPRDIDLIKQKLDTAEVIGSYIKLSRAGKNFKGLCPFHQEKTPSFVVSPERQIWHCFGCGAGGDLIKFVMLYENLEFPEALKLLADKAGVEISSFKGRDRRKLDILYEINEEAKKFFLQNLRSNKDVLSYLNERGLKNSTIKEFDLGFAPGGESLTLHLLNSGYKLEDVIRSGVSHKNNKGLYRDRFHQRIIFPIINELGRTVAFTGRIFKENKNTQAPKYLNTSETPVFNKSKIFYGLDKSKREIIKEKSVFLVEGQMDLLISWQSGIKNVAAVSGTGLTLHHLTKLKRLAETIILGFDNDKGGLMALERSLDIFSKFDFHVKAVDLGGYGDPAEAFLKNSDLTEKAIKNAKPAFIHLFEYYFSKNSPSDVLSKKKITRKLLGKINQLKSAIDQEEWIDRLAEYSGISAVSLKMELDNMKNTKTEQNSEEWEKVPTRQERIDLISERLLSLAFTDDNFFSIVKSNRNIFPAFYQGIIDSPSDKNSDIIELRSSVNFDTDDEQALEKEFNELLKHLRIEFLKRKQILLKQEMKEASDDEKKTNSLLSDFYKIAREINELKNKNYERKKN